MSGKTPSVKAAAAEALAVQAFVGSEHPSDTLEVAQHLQSLWKGVGFTSHCSSPSSSKVEAVKSLAERISVPHRYKRSPIKTSLLDAFFIPFQLDAMLT